MTAPEALQVVFLMLTFATSGEEIEALRPDPSEVMYLMCLPGMQYVKWANRTDLDDFWTDPLVKRLYKNHIHAMASRVNVYNGEQPEWCQFACCLSWSCPYVYS